MSIWFRYSLVILLAFTVGLPVAQGQQGQLSTTQLAGADTAFNPITTAVPFLRIAPDARSAGIGDAGIATSPDPNALYWNASKLAFAEDDLAISTSYTPWLRDLVDDVYLAQLSGYKRVDDVQAVGLSLIFFNLGSIQFTDVNGNELQQHNPREYTINAAYARKLTEQFSAGLVLKYIHSNLAAGQDVQGIGITPGQSVSADVSVYYEDDLNISGYQSHLALGANISNIGSKISYTRAADRQFIPTNLGLGSAFTMHFDAYNALTFIFDFNKLLVPTPRPDDTITKPVISGMLGSFGDAPGGFSEEVREFMYSFGVEYWYADQFAVRFGHFNEHQTKGNRKFLTAGAGLRMNVFGLDVSYLIPTNIVRSPLDNTLRFTLTFNFEHLKKQASDGRPEG